METVLCLSGRLQRCPRTLGTTFGGLVAWKNLIRKQHQREAAFASRTVVHISYISASYAFSGVPFSGALEKDYHQLPSITTKEKWEMTKTRMMHDIKVCASVSLAEAEASRFFHACTAESGAEEAAWLGAASAPSHVTCRAGGLLLISASTGYSKSQVGDSPLDS